jgi:hypothetical protein
MSLLYYKNGSMFYVTHIVREISHTKSLKLKLVYNIFDKCNESIHFDNSITTYVFVNDLMMIFADRNMQWDVNKIT